MDLNSQGRDKHTASGQTGSQRRGDGLGGGPAGQGGLGRPSSGGSFGKRAAFGGGGLGVILLIAAFFLFGGNGGSAGDLLGSLAGGDGSPAPQQ
jgi:hypothetical protein